MNADLFWDGLREEIQSQSVSRHPLYRDLVDGSLQRETIAELCAQLKYTVLDGISSLSMIIPQAPRHIKKELAANLFGELCGTAAEPSHWELALKAGAAAEGCSDRICDHGHSHLPNGRTAPAAQPPRRTFGVLKLSALEKPSVSR